MKRFDYALPEKLTDVFDFLKEPDSVLKAGGVDLLDLMKEGIEEPERLVNINSLKELNFVRTDESGNLRIGPTITLAELAGNRQISTKYRALTQAAEGAATPQIRNMATLGGNLCQRPRCWYFRSSDFDCLRKGGSHCFALAGENQYHAIFGNNYGCVIVHPSAAATALIALNAKLKIASETAEREIGVDEFFVAPNQNIKRENILQQGEVMTEISLPPAGTGFRSFYYKQKEKQAQDWPNAEVAVALNMNGSRCTEARIVLGAAAPIPWRAPKAEAVLKNQVISVKIAKMAAAEAMRDAQPLSENGYKVPVFQAVIYRTICWAAGIDPFA